MTARYAGHLVGPHGTGHYGEEAAYFPIAHPTSGHPVNLTPAYEIEPGPLPVAGDQPALFRFRDLLPLAGTDQPVSLGEGSTPLLPLPCLAGRFGLRNLWVKDESRNPTWSYKDRLAAVAVTKARARGADTVVVSTTGNHGAAVAAYAAAAGLRCVALTLHSVPPTMRTLVQVFGAIVVAYDQPADRWSVMRQVVEERGWVPMSSFTQPPAGSNPFGVDGYKTIAYELFQQLGHAPDVVVVPTAYADGLAGIHRGFTDLRAPRPDRAIAEAGGSRGPRQPVPAGTRAGPPVPRSSADACICLVLHRSRLRHQPGVASLQESAGLAVPVHDNGDIMAMQRELARTQGLYLEAASLTALIAVRRLLADRVLHPDHEVVFLGTSTGLKDVAATSAALPEPATAAPTLAALDEIVAAVAEPALPEKVHHGTE